MKGAIITYESNLSKWEEKFFIGKAIKNSKIEILQNQIAHSVYKIPVYNDKPSEKVVLKMIDFLKREKIQKILLSNQIKAFPWVVDFFYDSFSIYQGKAIINYGVYDILRKYVLKNELSLEDCSLVFITDSPEQAEEMIRKLYFHVKKIYIKTEKWHLFLHVFDLFLKEYGIFITLYDKEEKDMIFIDMDGKEEGKISFSEKSIEKNEIIYYMKEKWNGLSQYVKMNQCTLEYLTEREYGSCDKQAVLRFFQKYSPKVSKINKKCVDKRDFIGYN